MGCDIHMWAEVKLADKGEWRSVGRIFKNVYHDPDDPTIMIVGEDGREFEYNPAYTPQPYESRNYNLFAILANVRNGHGFAGCDTGDGFNPIAMPRGVPTDADEFYKKQAARWEGDGHSHSWFTLAELEAYDWDQKTKHRGFVSMEEYKEFKNNGKPQSWSGGISGGTIKIVENEFMDRLLDMAEDNGFHYYTKVQWEESYRESVRGFLEITVPALRKLAKMKRVEDVRIVFFFDN